MKLIIGLGNPEKKYDGTRHNVGFFVLDVFAEQHQAIWRDQPKMKGWVAELNVNGEKVLLLKPSTYYNLVGESARALKDFYKIDNNDILIVHDELALPFGTLRSRQGGSDAGNNGIKSINQHLGLDTHRVRIGIWNEQRDMIDDADFVLGKFTQDERAHMPKILDQAEHLLANFASDAMTHHTTKI